MSLNKKSIKLLAYDIENEDIKMPHSDLFEKLKEKLDKGGIANIRRMKLNSNSNEEDLLSDFATTDRYVFGVMFRIAPSKEIPRIPDEFFNNPKIEFNDIYNEHEEIQFTCKEHYYFALNEYFLVTSLPKSKIKSLQVYLNWLLEATRGDKLYSFISKIKTCEQIKLSEIKHIYFKSSNKDVESRDDFSIFDLSIDVLKKLLLDTKNLSEIINDNIFSAKLMINISKPRKMDNKDYEKLLGTYMTPLSDEDRVSFKLKNGKTVSGENMLQYKDVEVELIDNSRISNIDLIQEMEKYLKELKELQ